MSKSIISETILRNVRVLAVDQTVEEKDGQKVVVGKTATVELDPQQAETLALVAAARHAFTDAAQPPRFAIADARRRRAIESGKTDSQYGALRREHQSTPR